MDSLPSVEKDCSRKTVQGGDSRRRKPHTPSYRLLLTSYKQQKTPRGFNHEALFNI